MGELKARDSRIFNYRVDYVYRVLTDIASYHRWWPREISFELQYLDPGIIGTIVDVHNGMFVRWKSVVSGFKPNKLLAIDYVEGSWVGQTYWRFEDKGGKTELTLEIDLDVNRAWLSFVSNFISFSRFHSRQMQKVFGNLDKYLRENESLYFSGPIVAGMDHIVITVSDIEKSCRFYHEVLGLEVITFAEGRKALRFGSQKINLHQSGGEYEPKAANPMPGTADICFVSKAPVEATAAWLKSKNVEIIKGPVKRTGAAGEMTSVYLRDPDGNLIELGCYHK